MTERIWEIIWGMDYAWVLTHSARYTYLDQPPTACCVAGLRRGDGRMWVRTEKERVGWKGSIWREGVVCVTVALHNTLTWSITSRSEMYRVGEEVKSGMLSCVSAKSWHSRRFFHPSILILTVLLLREQSSLPSSAEHIETPLCLAQIPSFLEIPVFYSASVMHDSLIHLLCLFTRFAQKWWAKKPCLGLRPHMSQFRCWNVCKILFVTKHL